MKHHLKILILLVVLTLSGCAGEAAPMSTPTASGMIEISLNAAEREAIFNAVWTTVNEKYFDPTFGGKDWYAIGGEYRQKLAEVQDAEAFYLEVLNPMLFELGVSHLVALPAELANEIDRMTFSDGSLGMDIRLLDEKPVIIRVIDGSPAAEAGLRPGYVIASVDGRTLEDFAAEGLETPPYNEAHQRARRIGGMLSAMYEKVGTQAVIEYLDGDDQPGHTVLHFAPRVSASCGQIDPSLPPACAEIEVKRLAGDTGYLRFSGFLEPVLDGVLEAIDDLHDAPALIIDLRGNPGGTFPVRTAIASQLVGKPELFMRYQQRDELREAYLDPVPDPYTGKVVILVDELSASSSEEFSGSLQALGRATIVGSRTQGNCLVMNLELLPHNAILMYPYGQSQTPDGRVLEYNGVLPDIEAALDRDGLLQGIDAQLQAAIDYLEAGRD